MRTEETSIPVIRKHLKSPGENACDLLPEHDRREAKKIIPGKNLKSLFI